MRTCTAPVSTGNQVQIQSRQRLPKSAIKHDISPRVRCTLLDRKRCVLQVRLSAAEPVHSSGVLNILSYCVGQSVTSNNARVKYHARSNFPKFENRPRMNLRNILSGLHADEARSPQIQSCLLSYLQAGLVCLILVLEFGMRISNVVCVQGVPT